VETRGKSFLEKFLLASHSEKLLPIQPRLFAAMVVQKQQTGGCRAHFRFEHSQRDAFLWVTHARFQVARTSLHPNREVRLYATEYCCASHARVAAMADFLYTFCLHQAKRFL